MLVRLLADDPRLTVKLIGGVARRVREVENTLTG